MAMKLTKSQEKEIKVWEYFIPSWCKWGQKTDEDVKKFFEWSEQGKHRDIATKYGENSYFNALVWGKKWAYRNVHELFEQGVLEGTMPYMDIVPNTPKEVVEFMKKEMFKGNDADIIEACRTKVYDIFYYFNEADLCEVRFELLDPHVDYFVVCEANQTFSGVPRAFEFDIKRYTKWKHKIIYHQVTDVPSGFWDENCDQQILGWARSSPNVTREHLVWLKEFYIKEHVRRTLEKILKPDDVCYISDLDEVWNWELKPDFSKDVIYKPKQLPYIYYMNMRTDEDWLGWSGTICANWRTIDKGIINHLRTDELTKFVVLENGGWHFGSIGGKEKKMEASKHPFYNKAIWTAREKNMRVDESDLPNIDKQKWIHLFQ